MSTERSTVLLIAAACLIVLALTSWHRWLLVHGAPADRPTDCVSRPYVPYTGADYHRHAWQLPDGRILGWSAEEDTTIYPHPGCY